MIDNKKEKLILHLKPNYCEFTAFVLDPFVFIIGFFLSFVLFSINTWWSILLAIVIFIVSLGFVKSLFLKEVYLYEDRVTLIWYLFWKKTILTQDIKKVRRLRDGWFCGKFTFMKRDFFDYSSLWVIVNESVLGAEESIKLKREIKKLIGETR